MSVEEQRQAGMTLLNEIIEACERNREMGRNSLSRDDFEKATGIVMTLSVTGIIGEEEASALREALYKKHYTPAYNGR